MAGEIINQTLGQAGLVNPNSGLINWVGSNYFAITIILTVVCIFMLPFAIKGFMGLWGWIQNTFIKPKKGYIRIKQKLPNDRLRTVDVIPTGKMISYKTYEGKDLTMPFKNEKGWIAFEGHMPFIMLDSNNIQMNLQDSAVKGVMSQEEFTDGTKFAYETGKIYGSGDVLGKIKMLLMIFGILMIGGILMVGFMTYSLKGDIKKATITPETLYAGFMNITMQRQSINQTTPTLIPVVG